MDLKDFIENLKNEHQEYIQKMENWKKLLHFKFNEDLLEKIINFLKEDIQNHAEKEEERLNQKIEEKYPDFDSQAIIFAHDVLDEAIEDVIYYYEKYKKNKKYKDRLVNSIEKVFTMLKDHFMEEENFLFPNVYKEEKEWL
ncbi:hemerythrin domain-containing protein [Hydrogenothermus marinus]|uniref:Hemerythrin HHE cation binding domain-containing protein n=1 Tax=Hydrogenothermus marinus TaxID=133270 RepID=A0A3M0BA40_9AQUI|nr:hemerythrin domain-containing protein [Hydrogenothermus marinus]RMA93344.1 hemerythrin HHE cation binding domain-containing protein [Hydrogenothermus marinus]